jgi:hypothetical protein
MSVMTYLVTPADAGVHFHVWTMDTGFRRYDGVGLKKCRPILVGALQ